jgi:hypothetical protein
VALPISGQIVPLARAATIGEDNCELLAGHKEVATYDQGITGILDAIRQNMAPPPATKKRPIGFVVTEK